MKVTRRQFAAKKIALLAMSSLLAVQIACGPLAFQNAALACGPFFDQTIFSLNGHPDFPFKLYVKGKLGIVKPSYDVPYLIVAYRYMQGKPLTAGEQAGYLAYWVHFFQHGYSDNPPESDQWLKDRQKVGGKLDQALAYTSVYRQSTQDGPSYMNCAGDAFKNASANLAKLVSKYGADSPVTKEWLKGQDAVFCHCQSPGFDYRANKQNPEPRFPEKLPESTQLELRQDRMYQLAAAYFYAEKLDDALKIWGAIAADKASPWQTTARYMEARTLIRKGTLTKKTGYDSESLGKALAYLKQLATSPDLSTFKKSVDDLIDFVQLRLDPDQVCLDLTKILSAPYSGDDLTRKIDNFMFVYEPPSDDSSDQPNNRPKVKPPAPASGAAKEDMIEWMTCFISKDKAQIAVAAENFKKHKTLPWAIAYASKLTGSEPDSDEVEKILAKTAKSDSGFVSASYYRAMLLLGGKHAKEAEAVIAAAISNADITPSSANDLSYLELERASNLDQFLTLSFRPPAVVSGGADAFEGCDDYEAAEKIAAFAKLAPVLLPESAKAINTAFPLSFLVSAASSKGVPASYVKQFAQAAYCRAIVLGDHDTAAKVTGLLKQGYPVVAKEVTDYENAKSLTDKEFAAILLMLRCPGMRPMVTGGTSRGTAFEKIDDYQDNWWGVDQLTDSGDRGGADSSTELLVPTAFLNAADKTQAKSQLAKLKALGETPNYMGKITIAYAKAHPTDPRVPEALALVVKATHFGSADQGKTTAISTQAFQLLHKGYPGNPWTKKTPYHY